LQQSEYSIQGKFSTIKTINLIYREGMLGYAITIMIVGTLTSLVGGWIKGPNWPRPVLIGLFLTFLGATAALMYVQMSSPQPNDTSSPVATPTRIALSDKSPVRVWWLGQGDTIQIQWDPADSDEVHSYSVDIYGMAPIRNYYNLGYRIGEELIRQMMAMYLVLLTLYLTRVMAIWFLMLVTFIIFQRETYQLVN